MRETLNRLGLFSVIIVILYGSLTSGTAVSSGGLPIHFVAYFILAAAFLINFHDTRRGHLEAILAAGALAFMIEGAQFFLSYRVFSLIDFGVSFAGASLITLDHHLDLVTWFVEYEDRMIERFLI